MFSHISVVMSARTARAFSRLLRRQLKMLDLQFLVPGEIVGHGLGRAAAAAGIERPEGPGDDAAAR